MISNSSVRTKKFFIIILPVLYILIALLLFSLVATKMIDRLPPTQNEISFEGANFNETLHSEILSRLALAQNFTTNNLIAEDGFVYLYVSKSNNTLNSNQTNSEALSYALYWTASDRRHVLFNKELSFIEKYMQHPDKKYLMWRLEENRNAIGDGRNSATDAELRAIKALLVANSYWNDKTYEKKINEIAKSLENIAITSDKLFSSYAGVYETGKVWKTEDVWLSYADFTVFRDLAHRRGQPWRSIYQNMKEAVLDSQLSSGLYQTELNKDRTYSSTLDASNHSINSLWIMVRAAESEDKDLQDSARKALNFYKESYNEKNIIYTSYTSEGSPASTSDAPWTYALVGRAAIALGDETFSNQMIGKLITFQNMNQSSFFYGAFVEGSKEEPQATQFTIQESIITLQAYIDKIGSHSLDEKRTS